MRARALIVGVLLGVTLGVAASAQDEVPAPAMEALLAEASGSVEVLALEEETWQSPAVGSKLNVGDTVRTGPKARALIKQGEAVELRLGSNTTLEIQVPEEGEQLEHSVTLLHGLLQTKVHAPPGGQTPFEVLTGNAVAGVRGTEFTTAVGLDGVVRTSVEEGKVAFSGDQGEILLTRGQMSELAAGVAPAAAQPSANVDWEAWVQERRERALERREEHLQAAAEGAQRFHERLKNLREARKERVEELRVLAEKARMAKHSGQEEAYERARARMRELVIEGAKARRQIRREAARLQANKFRTGELVAAQGGAAGVGNEELKARFGQARGRLDPAMRQLLRDVHRELKAEITSERVLKRAHNLVKREQRKHHRRHHRRWHRRSGP